MNSAPTAGQIEAMEAEAWADLQRSLPTQLRDDLGVSVVCRNGATLLLANRTRELPINRVIGLGLEIPLSEHELDQVVAAYGEAGVERFIVQWSPEAAPGHATTWFAERGFVLLSHISKLYRVLQDTSALPMPASGLHIERVEPSEAALFERIVAPSLGVPEGLGPGIRSTIGKPGWRFYLAYDGPRPVAGAALYTRGEGGWLGVGATLPADRGRGAQTALLTRRLADARESGCVWVTADTLVTKLPSQSRRNMERQGFVHRYDRPNYVLEMPVATRTSQPST